MKKFYSLFLFVVAALFGVTAQAQVRADALLFSFIISVIP